MNLGPAILVIGAGSIGQRHIRNFHALGCHVIAVDPNQQNAHGARCHGAITPPENELLDGTHVVDGVVIATPAATHLDLIRTYQHEWPLLVEKPVALDSQLESLIDFEGDRLMVGYMMRFHPVMEQRSRITSARLALHANRATWPGSAGRGDLMLECSHEIDLILQLGANAAIAVGQASEYAARIEFGADYAVSIYDNPVNIPQSRSWFTKDRHADSVIAWPHMNQPQIDQLYMAEARHFLGVIDGEPIGPACTLQQAMTVLDVIRRIRRNQTWRMHQ